MSQKKKESLLLQEILPLSSSLLSCHSLCQFLDSKCSSIFDRDILEQLLNRMHKSPDGKFTAQEFVKVWLEADRILSEKVVAQMQKVDEYEARK
jgi:hypothetical protein